MDPKVRALITLGRSLRSRGDTASANTIFEALRALGIEPDANV
jgi:hypothetical protein